MKKFYISIVVIATLFATFSSSQAQSSEIKLSQPMDIGEGCKNIDIAKFEFVEKDWFEKKLIEDADWQRDDNSWDVYLESNKIMVSTAIYYNRFKFDIDGGYFLSENHGEFGGKIDFIGNDGVNYTVLKCNPRYMFSIDNEVYLIEGLSHFGAHGNLYKLSYIKDKWESEKIYDFNGYPESYIIDQKNIYIIVDTIEYIYDGNYAVSSNDYSEIIKIPIFAEDIEIQHLLKIPSLSININSMAKKGNMIYIGHTGGLVIVNLKNNEVKFYTKN